MLCDVLFAAYVATVPGYIQLVDKHLTNCV